MRKQKNFKGVDDDEMNIIKSELNGDYEDFYPKMLPCTDILQYKVKFKFKNEKQKLYYNTISDNEITFVNGSAGSGKSFVAMAAALELLQNNDTPYNKILVIVPVIQSDDQSLGYLKGTLEEKIEPFAEPIKYTAQKIFDRSGNKESGVKIIKELIKCRFLEFKPSSFLRGCTIDNSVVIIEESQQFSQSSMKTILTRIGDNSKYIFTGDSLQVDNQNIIKKKEKNGLQYAIERLQGVENIGVVQFFNTDIVRNPIISHILDIWE